MNEYIKTYSNYLKNPEQCQNHMKALIKKYFFESSQWTEELYEIYKNNIPRNQYNIELTTNGSTNFIPTKYKYTGISFIMLKDLIWQLTHDFYDLNRRFWININYKSNNDYASTSLRNEGRIFDLNPNKEIKIDFKYSVWITSPFIANEIFPTHLEYIRQNNIIISLTETDVDSYDFPKDIYINNQMRSWKEGTSFYTCRHGQKHFLENLFYAISDREIVDLFNFNGIKENTDKIYPLDKEFRKCKCGMIYRPMNFEPHAMKFFYDVNGKPVLKNIAAKLDFIKNYNNFQLIQEKTGKNFTLYTNVPVETQDLIKIKDFISNFYGSSSFNLNTSNEKFQVGRKFPLFWSLFEKNNFYLHKFVKLAQFSLEDN